MPSPLVEHLQVCDELLRLALDENRYLKQHQSIPEPSLLERHQTLVDRLETTLAGLRDGDTARVPADPALRSERAAVIEQARARLLQILHLLRENEQLVLRYSLGTPRPPIQFTPPPLNRLQKLYERHSG